jgi:TRAP-type C4-dicarboxylate transport system permease small subunit
MTTPEETHRGKRIALRVFTWPSVVIVVAMLVHVNVNALMRTFANEPVRYTLEITQYWYMPALAMLAFVVAQLRNQHLVVDLVDGWVRPRTLDAIVGAGSLVSAVICAGFAWFGLGEAVFATEIGQTAGSSTLPGWPTYWFVPLCFTALTVLFGASGVRLLLRAIRPQRVAEVEAS